MLQSPCKLCLVRPSCTTSCYEKIKWDQKVDWFRIPVILMLCIFVFIVCIIYSLILMFLNFIGIISKEKYHRLDPFIELERINQYDGFY